MAVVLLGFLSSGLLIGVLGEAELTPGVTDAAPVNADSTRVLELQSKFAGGQDQTAVVVYATDGSELSRADVADLERGFGDATGSRVPLQVSQDGTAAIGVTTVEGTGSEAVSGGVADLRADVARDLPEGVSSRSPGRPRSRPTFPPSSTAPTPACCWPPRWWWRSCSS